MAVRRIASAALIAAAIGCSQPAPPPAKPDAAAVKAMLAPYWAKFAAADVGCNATGQGALVSSDASLDAMGLASMKGRSAFEAMINNGCKTTKPTSFSVNPSEDWADGDHLYERGSYAEASMTGTKGKTEYGRYFAMFDKDSSGNVLMSKGTWFPDSSPAMKPAKAPAKMAAPSKAAPAKATGTKKAPAKAAKKSGD